MFSIEASDRNYILTGLYRGNNPVGGFYSKSISLLSPLTYVTN